MLWHSYPPPLSLLHSLSLLSQNFCNTEISRSRVSTLVRPNTSTTQRSRASTLKRYLCYCVIASRSQAKNSLVSFCPRPLARFCDRRFEVQALLHFNLSRVLRFLFSAMSQSRAPRHIRLRTPVPPKPRASAIPHNSVAELSSTGPRKLSCLRVVVLSRTPASIQSSFLYPAVLPRSQFLVLRSSSSSTMRRSRNSKFPGIQCPRALPSTAHTLPSSHVLALTFRHAQGSSRFRSFALSRCSASMSY